eukprot:Gregarina_sp_Poly_1__5719@NODE_3005_length_1458_cov_48_349389_g1902_i0_p2_GENE_NODE_3005_length_1458_cov_48_349389_g1902_i0NODE_3005_length_1458_cov_48_349389_g1902_i0_p2_ORF_typecomplete_len116_score4_17Gag_p19/PF02228_16/8_2Gag_p19/PF02228_16/52_NODE_3005_length_1458_cov_48_349389_g1902_i054401
MPCDQPYDLSEERYYCASYGGSGAEGTLSQQWWLNTQQAQRLAPYWTAMSSDPWPSPAYSTPSTQASTPTLHFLQSSKSLPQCRLGYVVYRLGPGMYHSGGPKLKRPFNLLRHCC